jgi:hypothetical protein
LRYLSTPKLTLTIYNPREIHLKGIFFRSTIYEYEELTHFDYATYM